MYTMMTETLVTETMSRVGKSNFISELDGMGWRGSYMYNPIKFLMDYISNSPESDRFEAEQFVRTDMINILNAYGFLYVDGQIIEAVAY